MSYGAKSKPETQRVLNARSWDNFIGCVQLTPKASWALCEVKIVSHGDPMSSPEPDCKGQGRVKMKKEAKVVYSPEPPITELPPPPAKKARSTATTRMLSQLQAKRNTESPFDAIYYILADRWRCPDLQCTRGRTRKCCYIGGKNKDLHFPIEPANIRQWAESIHSSEPQVDFNTMPHNLRVQLVAGVYSEVSRASTSARKPKKTSIEGNNTPTITPSQINQLGDNQPPSSPPLIDSSQLPHYSVERSWIPTTIRPQSKTPARPSTPQEIFDLTTIRDSSPIKPPEPSSPFHIAPPDDQLLAFAEFLQSVLPEQRHDDIQLIIELLVDQGYTLSQIKNLIIAELHELNGSIKGGVLALIKEQLRPFRQQYNKQARSQESGDFNMESTHIHTHYAI